MKSAAGARQVCANSYRISSIFGGGGGGGGGGGAVGVWWLGCLTSIPRLSRSVWACDDLQKRDQGGALFERNAVKRVCADPRFCGAAQVARSEAKGPRQPGRLFFAYFLLAKQKKVSCRRATPGQPANAEKTKAQINAKPSQIQRTQLAIN